MYLVPLSLDQFNVSLHNKSNSFFKKNTDPNLLNSRIFQNWLIDHSRRKQKQSPL